MSNLSLDQWGVITPNSEMKKPLILSDAHALYLYDHDCEERRVELQIENRLAEERAEEQRLQQAHEEYCEKNYIRVGGN